MFQKKQQKTFSLTGKNSTGKSPFIYSEMLNSLTVVTGVGLQGRCIDVEAADMSNTGQ